MTDIRSDWQQVSVGDREMAVYVSAPQGGGARPAVLVLQEIFGVNSYVRTMADRVAAEGYVAIAPDLFHRMGDRWEGRYDDWPPALDRMGRFDDEAALKDIAAVIAWARTRPDVAGRVGVLGFCLGGRLAYSLACTPDVQASVAFYGVGIPGAPLQKTASLSAPLMLFFAEKDQHANPGADVPKIEAALKEHGKAAEITVWPGVDHGFFNHEREAYDAKTAAEAWPRALRFFGQHLGG
jgi:carboxymethylenebutenolidase